MVEQIKMLKTIVFSKNKIVPMSTDSKALCGVSSSKVGFRRRIIQEELLREGVITQKKT